MEFRKLTVSDLPSLLELYRQLDANDAECTAEQSMEVWRGIEDNPNIRYFGAVDGDRIVSSCYAVYIPNLTRGNRGICFIENVITDKEYRKRGHASRMIDMAVAFAKERHCYKVIFRAECPGRRRTASMKAKVSTGHPRERLICGWKTESIPGLRPHMQSLRLHRWMFHPGNCTDKRKRNHTG